MTFDYTVAHQTLDPRNPQVCTHFVVPDPQSLHLAGVVEHTQVVDGRYGPRNRTDEYSAAIFAVRGVRLHIAAESKPDLAVGTDHLGVASVHLVGCVVRIGCRGIVAVRQFDCSCIAMILSVALAVRNLPSRAGSFVRSVVYRDLLGICRSNSSKYRGGSGVGARCSR